MGKSNNYIFSLTLSAGMKLVIFTISPILQSYSLYDKVEFLILTYPNFVKITHMKVTFHYCHQNSKSKKINVRLTFDDYCIALII